MKKLLFQLLLLLFYVNAHALYDPPADRLPSTTTWVAGVPGGIPSNSYTNVTCSDATGGDTSDDTAAINNCIISANDYDAVYLPAGTYYINSSINMKSKVVVRGAGKGITYLRFTASTRTIFQMGSLLANSVNPDEWELITSGFEKGSTAVVVSDSSDYAAGQLALIAQADYSNPHVYRGGCNWAKITPTDTHPSSDYCSLGQINRIASVSGTTIYLDSPLHYDYSDTYDVAIGRSTFQVEESGIEELTIYRTQTGPGQNPDGQGEIMMGRTYKCWVKNVYIDRVSGPTINIGNSFQCTIHGCDLDDTWPGGYGSGGTGYGITPKLYSSNLLIENNWVRQMNIPFNFIGPTSGNVVAYNWMDVATRDATYWQGYEALCHCSTPTMTLFEGNQISHLTPDCFWGNANDVLAFRNHLDSRFTEQDESYPYIDTHNRRAVNMEDCPSYGWSVIGNILGLSTESYSGYQTNSASNDPYIYEIGHETTRTEILRHYNYDHHNDATRTCNQETEGCHGTNSSDTDIRDSYYLTSKPDWWCNESDWPPIGPDVSCTGDYCSDSMAYMNPAQIRYEGLTCTTTSVEICNNGLDDDDDGLIDCFDPDCDGEDGSDAPGIQECHYGIQSISIGTGGGGSSMQ